MTARAPTSALDSRRHCRIPVFELSCAAVDARRVERALVSVDGVISAYLNPVTGSAYVDHDTTVEALALVQAIEGAGFRAGLPVDA